jgi:alkaline phosphatase D
VASARRGPFPTLDARLFAGAVELGAVDDRSVRIWVRQAGEPRVEGTLEVEGQRPVLGSVELSQATDWTGSIVFALDEPAPDCPFSCRVGARVLTGRLTPSPGTASTLGLAFGSCNLPIRGDPTGRIGWAQGALIYPAMRARMQAVGARLLLLIGDQLYSDIPAPISIPTAFDERREQRAVLFGEMLTAFRERYRLFFDAPGFRELREQFPTYCIWDDHEIVDAWGSQLERRPNDPVLFDAAARAYWEYQHQRNPGSRATPPFEYGFWFGDVGFFVLDLRGERDYDRKVLLGPSQWEALQSFLSECDRNGTTSVFVVASVPIAHVSRWAVLSLGWVHAAVEANIRDRWCSAGFIADRNRLLDTLIEWQTAAPTRQVFVLSGDVHAASAFTIRQRKGTGVIRQLNSSAFSHPLHGADLLLNRAATYLPNLFEPRYRFRRHALVYENNFGLVRLEPLPAGGHRVEFTVQAWQPRRRALRVGARIVCTPANPLRRRRRVQTAVPR